MASATSAGSASPDSHSTDLHNHASANHKRAPSRLLSLPAELQLAIWEFVVIQEEPLLLNCPCDSFYGGWSEEYYAEVDLWENGTKHPPWQPALTRVCSSIRADALPMWFKHNRFQAGYCWETNRGMTLDWLEIIGAENRKLIKHFYFHDANFEHDDNSPSDLRKLKRSKVFREFGGVMQSTYDGECCRHDVLFCDKVVDEELEGLARLFDGYSIA